MLVTIKAQGAITWADPRNSITAFDLAYALKEEDCRVLGPISEAKSESSTRLCEVFGKKGGN
jgi:hypothetical protein